MGVCLRSLCAAFLLVQQKRKTHAAFSLSLPAARLSARRRTRFASPLSSTELFNMSSSSRTKEVRGWRPGSRRGEGRKKEEEGVGSGGVGFALAQIDLACSALVAACPRVGRGRIDPWILPKDSGLAGRRGSQQACDLVGLGVGAPNAAAAVRVCLFSLPHPQFSFFHPFTPSARLESRSLSPMNRQSPTSSSTVRRLPPRPWRGSTARC